MSWETVKLSQIASSQYGFTASTTSEPIGPRFLRITDIVPSSISWDNVPFCAADDATRRKYLLRKGDIVVARTGATTGYAKLIRADVDAIFASYLVRFQITDERANPDFVGRILESHVYKAYVDGVKGGAAQPNANAVSLGNFEFKLPPLSTQERIASILSAYDDLIENNRRRIGLLEQAARLLYREWFVHLRFPGHETAKIVDGLPEGWERCAVDDLLILQRGFDLPVGNRKEGSVPVYGSTGIVGYHNEPKIPAPAIITGRSGSLGQVVLCDVPCWPLNTALWVKELKGVPASFAFFLLINLELSKYNGGASVPTLDRKVVHRLAVVRPAQNVLDQFDHMATTSFQTIAKLQKQNAQLTRARDLLLPRLMDGRITV